MFSVETCSCFYFIFFKNKFKSGEGGIGPLILTHIALPLLNILISYIYFYVNIVYINWTTLAKNPGYTTADALLRRRGGGRHVRRGPGGRVRGPRGR